MKHVTKNMNGVIKELPKSIDLEAIVTGTSYFYITHVDTLYI
jgi:hypothetical protein